MKILFLHGWHSAPGGTKSQFLESHGHTVIGPRLDDDDYDAAVRTAQGEYDRHRPDVIVGSSRGAAIAMDLASGETPLVLLCPAWKNWAKIASVKPETLILHSRQDEVVPFADSEELIRNSALPETALIEVGHEHPLADPQSLEMLRKACERLAHCPR